MIEKAKVIEIKENLARVEIRRVSACGESCASCKGGCSPTNAYVDAVNMVGAAAGQYVEIEMSTKTFLAAVVITYGIPLIMLLAGILGGSFLVDAFSLNINADLGGVFLGFVFMAISYMIVSRQDKRYSRNGKIKFEIIRIL